MTRNLLRIVPCLKQAFHNLIPGGKRTMKLNMPMLLLLVAVVVFGNYEAFGQFVWTRDIQNPVFSGGGSGAWDNDVAVPWVIFNSDSAKYEMWYTGPPASGGKIGFAISSDGTTWKRELNPVLSPSPGTWDSLLAGVPCVLRENGLYKMWYTGTATNSSGNYVGTRIGYATSPDGRNWTKYAGNPVFTPGASTWEAGGVAYCSVIKSAGGYVMFYNGCIANANLNRIGRATSVDGITWQRDTLHNPVLNIGGPGAWDGNIYLPRVLDVGGKYYMWYTAEAIPGDNYPRIGLATSADSGKTWVKYAQNPVLTMGPSGSWDERWVELGSVFFKNSFHMWYDGGAPPYFQGRVGHATAPLLANVLRVPSQYSTIQAAINGAYNGDTVLVSDGTYYENIRFKGKKIVVASTYITTGDTLHISNTIIDGSHATNPDSGSVVSFISGEDTTSVLCGFTIRGGTGTNYLYNYGTGTVWFRAGGGIFCDNAGARIVRSIITRNRIVAPAGSGGGVGAFGTVASVPFVILEESRIADNSVQGTSSGTWSGAGGADFTGVAARIVNNRFERDTVVSNTGVAGGAMSLGGYSSGSPRPNGYIVGNVFRSNVASGTSDLANGGGLMIQGSGGGTMIQHNLLMANSAHSAYGSNGGGIYLFGAECTVVGNEIADNSAGGGASYGGGICIDSSAFRLENNIIRGNTSAYRGGGVDVWEPPQLGTGQVLVNNTICGNSAQVGGGLGVAYGSNVVSLNNIVWGNSASSSAPGIYVISATANVAYCDITGGYTGTGNLNADPKFVIGDSLYNLQPASPCIGRGIDSLQIGGVWYRAPAWDFAGRPRHRPLGPQAPDMGAQEEQTTVDVEERAALPVAYGLSQNYPNPFNPSTTIPYGLPHKSVVQLTIFNTLGQQVAVLQNGEQEAGYHEVKFDASKFSSGVYFYRMQAGDFIQTHKMLLVR